MKVEDIIKQVKNAPWNIQEDVCKKYNQNAPIFRIHTKLFKLIEKQRTQ